MPVAIDIVIAPSTRFGMPSMILAIIHVGIEHIGRVGVWPMSFVHTNTEAMGWLRTESPGPSVQGGQNDW